MQLFAFQFIFHLFLNAIRLDMKIPLRIKRNPRKIKENFPVKITSERESPRAVQVDGATSDCISHQTTSNFFAFFHTLNSKRCRHNNGNGVERKEEKRPKRKLFPFKHFCLICLPAMTKFCVL